MVAKRFGIKRVYITLLGLFILGSVLCAFAPSLPFLIAFRAVQGLGGGRLVPLWISLLFGVFPENEGPLNIRFLSIYPYCLLTTSDISLRALISDSVWKE